MMAEFLLILAAMLVGGTVQLLVYALRSVGTVDFSWRMFLITNRVRMFIGLLIFIVVSGAMVLIDGVGVVLPLLLEGIPAGIVSLSVYIQAGITGISVAGILVATIPSKK